MSHPDRLSFSSAAPRATAAFLMDPKTAPDIFPADDLAGLREWVDLVPGFIPAADWRNHRASLRRCDVVLAGWGAPVFDDELLDSMPRLRAVFYAAGSVKKILGESFWKRGIVVTACHAANAIPVAEFTVAQITLLLKDTYRFAAQVKATRTRVEWRPVAGAYESVVGLLSLGTIGRLVARKLQAMDVKVIAYDPLASPETFHDLGVRQVSLESLFAESNVVSVHAPLLPETTGLVTERLLRSMRPGASVLNTARGAIVDHDALARVLAERTDLFAMLDVTWPEPLPPDSMLYDLPNVVITPHIAGSMSGECRRMGQLAVAELQRFLRGEPLQHQVAAASLRHRA